MNSITTTSPQPAAREAIANYHLSEEQVRFFDENGYLVLRKWIQGEMLRQLQEASNRWMDKGLDVYNAVGREEALKRDYMFAKREGGREVFFRVNFLYDKGEDVALELLGSPQVLGVAESLNGRNFFPTYESLVFKSPGDGEAIPWHQDAVQKRNYRVWNYDLYLDDSKKENGALRVLPKSHFKKEDACSIAEKYGWDHPDIITVEMEPGDVLLHDVMVYHGSPRTLGGSLRRTIYYEFRSLEWNRDAGIWSEDWVNRRLKLIPYAMDKFATAYPDAETFQWKIDPELKPAEYASAAKDLRIVHEKDVGGSYCSATSSTAS